jgi:peptide/nickel transport system permease protein
MAVIAEDEAILGDFAGGLAGPPTTRRLVASQGTFGLAWRRFRRDRWAILGAGIVIGLILVAVFAPWIATHDPAEQFDDGLSMQGLPVPSTLFASTRFILGTDAVGRDLFSRIIYGTRVSLIVGILANLIALALGALIGATAGYVGGWGDSVLMRLTEIMMAFPTLLLAIALVAILRPSLWIIVGVIGLVYWTWIARVVYGQVRALRGREFIEAARCVGADDRRIILRHILPHLVPTLIVWGTLGVATNVMLEASLSYLGIGVQPPAPSWGGMIQQGQQFYRAAPWLIIFPGLAIMLTVFAFNLFGDGLRDALDPVQRKQMG